MCLTFTLQQTEPWTHCSLGVNNQTVSPYFTERGARPVIADGGPSIVHYTVHSPEIFSNLFFFFFSYRETLLSMQPFFKLLLVIHEVTHNATRLSLPGTTTVCCCRPPWKNLHLFSSVKVVILQWKRKSQITRKGTSKFVMKKRGIAYKSFGKCSQPEE